METGANSFQPSLSDAGFDLLKHRLTDLIEPLTDAQLLDLADGLHQMLRQRRSMRKRHIERMTERARQSEDVRAEGVRAGDVQAEASPEA